MPGCDGVEFDVRLSRDGVPVLLHDETLVRVQGRPEGVADLTTEELAAVGVPSLAGVLRALPVDAFLDVELKGADHGRATMDALAEGRGPSPARAVVSSFEASTLATVAELLPGWPRWLNVDDLSAATIDAAAAARCAGISVWWPAITTDAVAAAHTAGLVVAAWTVTSVDALDRLAAQGVVACCVEGPALDEDEAGSE